MIDIHSHILPCVDDGAKSKKETISMAAIAAAEGITHIVATPHFIYGHNKATKEQILTTIEKTNKVLEEEQIPVKILPGNEVYYSNEVLQQLSSEIILTLNNTKYLLIEFPMQELPLNAEELLYEIRLRGLQPIIAHPERYSRVIENPNLVKGWIEQGNLVQVNAMSITGRNGERVQETAKILLQHDMVHFIATDSHSPRARAPRIKEALEQVKVWTNQETVNYIKENGLAAIENREIIIQQPILYKKQNGFIEALRKIFQIKTKKALGRGI